MVTAKKTDHLHYGLKEQEMEEYLNDVTKM